MSGIDKLTFDIPHTNTYNERTGFTLRSIINTAYQNGLVHRSYWFPNENKPGIAFIDRHTDRPIEGCIIGYKGRMAGEGAIATIAQFNPSKFSSLRSFRHFLSRIDGPWFRGAIASRLDVAADYHEPFDEFIQHVDIIGRSFSRVYLDQQVGCPRTLYFGTGTDRIIIYDKLFQTGDDIYPADFPPEWIIQTRVERQLLNKLTIRDRVGDFITMENFPDVFDRLRSGELCLLDSVQNLHVEYALPHELTDSEQERRWLFEGMIRMSSYANARRFVNGNYNGNFVRDWERLMRVYPLAPTLQPNAVFQQGMHHFGRRRVPTFEMMMAA